MSNYPEWQPISSAEKPKRDGPVILAVDRCGRVRVVYWDHIENAFCLTIKTSFDRITFNPTHWMALPPPPVLEGVQ